MIAKHTPKPWTLAQYGESEPAFTVMWGEKAIARIVCPGLNGDDHKRVPSQAESEANARLIAAAPDLLSELQALRGQLIADGWKLEPSFAITSATNHERFARHSAVFYEMRKALSILLENFEDDADPRWIAARAALLRAQKENKA